MKRTIFLLYSFFVVISLSGCTTPEPIQDLANHLEELDANEQFSGVVLIAQDGLPIFEKAYGYANRNYDVANQIDTKFNLGSMSKMFTAVAIMQLVENGKISVNDTVIEYLPEYPNQEVAETVTIHQLLTHTSGMGDFFTQEYRDASKDRYKKLDDYLPLFTEHPLQFEPGTRGTYSNAGYLVLGIIIEETTGQTYFEYVDEEIYQKCGMTDSGSYEADRVVPNIAIGYAGNLRYYSDVSSNLFLLPFRGTSAGGGYSTAHDLHKFSRCLVNNQLLSPEYTDIMLEEKDSSPIPGLGGEYAYGFMVDTINNHRVVGHGGSFPGVCTMLNIYLDLGYTSVILSNSSNDCLRVISRVHETLTN